MHLKSFRKLIIYLARSEISWKTNNLKISAFINFHFLSAFFVQKMKFFLENFLNKCEQYWSFLRIYLYLQKQPPRCVLEKRYSENMQQVCRRTAMPKCDFNKVAQQLYWNRTSARVLSCKFAVYFQNTFPRSTTGWLLLYLPKKSLTQNFIFCSVLRTSAESCRFV